jgi:hypothetical protein
MFALRHLVDSDEYTLAGVRVYDTAEAGIDAGTLCGRSEIEILATADRRELIDADADIVLYIGKVETDTNRVR